MAYRKQNVFHGNANNELKNGKSYVPAVDRVGHDSESIVAFKGGFGIGNPVYDSRQQKVVYSFEVLDALPGTIMKDSDYVTQADTNVKGGIAIGDTTKITFDSDQARFSLTFAAGTIDSDNLTDVNENRTYIWSEEFGTANHVCEGYLVEIDDKVLHVKPTSSSIGWKAAMADGTLSFLYDSNNKMIARGKTINDDKNRYADADSDFMFHDDDA